MRCGQTGLRGGPLKSCSQTHSCRPLSHSLAWPIYCFYFPLTHRGPCPQRMEIEGWRDGSLARSMHHARRESSLIPSTHLRWPKLSNSRSLGSDTLSGLPWHCTHVYNTPSRHIYQHKNLIFFLKKETIFREPEFGYLKNYRVTQILSCDRYRETFWEHGLGG